MDHPKKVDIKRKKALKYKLHKLFIHPQFMNYIVYTTTEEQCSLGSVIK